MFKRIFSLILVASLLIFCSGCSLLYTAISAAAAYGVYQATKE